MTLSGLRIGLVGPVPPPAGGMANQTRQLSELLKSEGAAVTLIQLNPPYRPNWVKRLRGVRAAFRLLPYLLQLWRVAGRVDLIHVMANSGWSWHLYAAPAVWISDFRGRPIVVNYRGGEAAAFLERAAWLVRPTLTRATMLAVPSEFLKEVFARFGIAARVLPNIVDLARFRPRDPADRALRSPHIVVARNLEPIYDLATAIRAFARIRTHFSTATLSIAGTGPELEALQRLATDEELSDAVRFTGRLDRDQMADLYRHADVVLNPSRVNNMPNSVLEALACAVPVVSTNVGGVPYVVSHGKTALLVNAGDDAAMAAAALRVLAEPELSRALAKAGLDEVQRYSWQRVREMLDSIYGECLVRCATQMRAS